MGAMLSVADAHGVVAEGERGEGGGGVGGHREFGALCPAAECEGQGEYPVRAGFAGAVGEQVVASGVVEQRLA